MEGKKRVVPGEVCAERAERRNRSCKAALNAQKSAEAIVPVTHHNGEGLNLNYVRYLNVTL